MIYSVLPRTKFLIPRSGADVVSRPELLARLERALHRRLALISTPPGYGKTTLLAQLAEATDQPLAWCQLDAGDSDPVVFLSAFIESLRHTRNAPDSEACARMGRAALALLSNMEADLSITPRRVLTVLINELLEQVERSWLVVLEDYHEIANPAVHELLILLLENAPPGLTLIISTRADPPLPLARLRARGLLAEFRAEDLRFSEEEVRAWVRTRLPEATPEDIRALEDKTEGWAAGLQLVLAALAGRNPESRSRLIEGIQGSHRYLFDYLISEAFQRQPPATQRFLLVTSVLNQMDAAACAALPGIEHPQAMLAELERKNLFVSSLDEAHRWYRYHQLFREFLLDALRRDHPDLFQQAQRAAGRYYESQGQFEMAAQHYLAGEAADDAAQMLLRFAPDYIEHGRVVMLQRHLARLPEPVLARHPQLLLYHGDALRRLGYAGEADRRYQQARAAFEAAGDAVWLSRALVRLGELARSQGHYRQAQTLVTQALIHAPKDAHEDRARALIALAKSTGFLTGMDQGRALAEQALAEARLAGGAISLITLANILGSLGQIAWWHGDPQSTVRYATEALQILPDELSPIAARAHTSLAIPYLYWGHLDTALKHAERGLEIAQQLEMQELLPNAYTILGNVLTRMGETARAEAALRQSLEIAQQLGLAAYDQVMAAGYLAYNLYSQGRVDEAQQLAEGSLWAFAGNPDTYEVYVCRSVLADISLEKGRDEEAEQLFIDLLEVGERRRFRLPLAMVYFGLAYIALKRGDREKGVDYARRSLALVEPTNAVQLYLDQGERAVVVCRALKKAGGSSPFVDEVLARLRKNASARPRVIENKAVVVRTLGAFRVFVNGQEVSQERWVSARARDMLAYFITFRHDRIPMERVQEALWPQTASLGPRAFHTALYRVRQALRAGSESTKFILVQSGEYWLDAARFQVDVDEFDAALAQARHLMHQRPEEAERWFETALALYQGDYLANLYYDWLFPEQRRLREAHLQALRHLAGLRMNTRRYEDALSLLNQALALDPLQEQVHLDAMRCYAALGNRAAVARQYRQLEEALRRELGVGPDPVIRAAYENMMAVT